MLRFCKEVQIDPNSLVIWEAPKPHGMSVVDAYRDINLWKRLLTSYLKSSVDVIETNSYTKDEVQRIDEILRFVDRCSSKPVVAFVGPSDAGKSTMINVLTGIDALLTRWTPATSATILFKHIDDKPEWMANDDAWIFRAESKEIGWDFRRYDEYEYCKVLKVAGGELSVLSEYCNRNRNSKEAGVDSAVVYLDSELLRVCDIIDLPGFGTESYAESVQAHRAKEKADVVVFLCQANGFFNKNEDVSFLKDVIHQMPSVRIDSTSQPLSNLLIVATQAHIPGEKNLDAIFQRGHEVISEQLSEDVIRERFEMEKGYFVNCLRERFFSYSLENSLLRKKFESELQHLLTEIMPAFRMVELNKGIAEVRLKAGKEIGQKIREYESILRDREQAIEDHKIKTDNRDSFVSKVIDQRKHLLDLAQTFRRMNLSDLSIWERESITVGSIERMIRDRHYNRKQAQEYVASNVSDLYLAKTSQLTKASVLQFHEKVEKAIAELERTVSEWEKTEMGTVRIPFDVKGAWAGGLAGAGVLGALSLSVASLGNMGGYILVAKGVSLLSSLGISVGGTAAASSFVAAIGGPVTIAVALSLGALLLTKKVFGESWQTRLAKQVYKLFIDEKVLKQYQSRINQLWNDTEQALNSVTQSLIAKYDDELQNMERIIDTQDEEELRQCIVHYRQTRDFFVGLPWVGSDIYYVQASLLNAVSQMGQERLTLEDVRALLRQGSGPYAAPETVISSIERTVMDRLEAQQEFVGNQLIEQVIKEVISEFQKQKLSFANDRWYADDDIRHMMLEGFDRAQKEIDIACAWITGSAVNGEMERAMDEALRRKVTIKIHYGIKGTSHYSSGGDKNARTDVMAAKLHEKFGKKGLYLKKGNTHNKIFLCDDNFLLLGSFNFLSYNPFLYCEGRDETAWYSENPQRISELRRWYFNFP